MRTFWPGKTSGEPSTPSLVCYSRSARIGSTRSWDSRRVVAGCGDDCRALYLLDPKPTPPRHTTQQVAQARHMACSLRGMTLHHPLEDDVMTANRDRIEDLVLRIQSGFLDNPTLALTQPAAEKRFGIDESHVLVCSER